MIVPIVIVEKNGPLAAAIFEAAVIRAWMGMPTRTAVGMAPGGLGAFPNRDRKGAGSVQPGHWRFDGPVRAVRRAALAENQVMRRFAGASIVALALLDACYIAAALAVGRPQPLYAILLGVGLHIGLVSLLLWLAYRVRQGRRLATALIVLCLCGLPILMVLALGLSGKLGAVPTATKLTGFPLTACWLAGLTSCTVLYCRAAVGKPT